ncbi:MAG: glutathione S-transferase family protein [Hyphomicrobiales bacterium]|nr:glutathione S-transferase family protein [Hyphomicrobiales bacterium]
MPVLRSSPPSPFARKVILAAAVAGLSDAFTLVVADTNDEHDSLRQQNPLGKIPCLILDDGTALYDSRVIVEWLDMQAGGNVLIPHAPAERLRVLTFQALCDGLMDAAVVTRYEFVMREESIRSARWLAHQAGKIERALAVMAKQVPVGRHDIGAVALACALGYLDLRFEGRWRAQYPGLVAWLDRFAAEVPAFEATRAKIPA